MISDALMQGVIEIALKAGHAIMEVYDGEIAVSRKEDNSPLTQADIAAHHIIDASLSRLTPELPILSEESVALPYAQRRDWQRYWLVDPLDGTREFIKRNGEFTVNIALIEHHAPVLGVVYAPALELLFYAADGQGAFKRAGAGETQPIRTRRLEAAHLTVAGSRSHADARLMDFLSAVGPHTLLSMGSSLKICLVAEGRADVYPRLGPTSEWDTAAAQCVLEQAGGQLVGCDNQPFRYNAKESLLNPEFFAVGAEAPNWSRYLP